MNLWKDLKTGPKPPGIVHAVVEVPKGSRIKYKFAGKDEWYLTFDQILYVPMFYVGNYGIVPQTLWDDGSPLKILVIMDETVVPETVIVSKPVAVLEMNVEGRRSDKIIAVAQDDPRYAHLEDLRDLDKRIQDQIAHFFYSYNSIDGKKVELLGWKDAKFAQKAITHAQKLFKSKVK